ncbi:hypothetical protein Hanom_Chr08g00724251 [Helianthus anomalus]
MKLDRPDSFSTFKRKKPNNNQLKDVISKQQLLKIRRKEIGENCINNLEIKKSYNGEKKQVFSIKYTDGPCGLQKFWIWSLAFQNYKNGPCSLHFVTHLVPNLGVKCHLRPCGLFTFAISGQISKLHHFPPWHV